MKRGIKCIATKEEVHTLFEDDEYSLRKNGSISFMVVYIMG